MALPVHSKSFPWVDHFAWGPTFRMNLSATTTPIPLWDSAVEFYRLPQLVGGKIYWGGWYEAGTAFNGPGTIVVRGTFNLGVIAETIVGPITLATSVSPTGEIRVNFSIGRVF